MDHIGVLKRAWRVTWRYRILWLFGLFVGGTGGGGGGGGGNLTGSRDIDALPMREIERVGYWMQDNIALIAATGAFFAVLGLGMFILSVAAKGGLVFLVNEAEDERPVRGMDGWAAGFRNWLKVFGIAFVLYVPFFILLMLVLVATFAPLLAPLLGGDQPGPQAFVGLCGGLAFGGFALLLLGILIGLLDTLAVRHAVLDGSGVFRSIGEAWTDVRSRFKDVFIMWLLMVAVGIAYGIVVGILAAVFAFGIMAAVFAEAFIAAALIGFTLLLFLLLPNAIYGAFTSAVWTVFFRRLTGREVVETPADPGYSPPLAPGQPAAPTPPEAPAAPEAPVAPDTPKAPDTPSPPAAPAPPPEAPRGPAPPIAPPRPRQEPPPEEEG